MIFSTHAIRMRTNRMSETKKNRIAYPSDGLFGCGMMPQL